MVRFKLCTRGVEVKIRTTFCCFSKLTLFVRTLWDPLFEIRFLIYFWNFILRLKILSSKWSLKSPKSCKKCQNYLLTNHEVIWKISKLTKKRDQGMENQFFVVCFKICICGVGFKLRGVLCFWKMEVFVKSLQIHFLVDQLFNLF